MENKFKTTIDLVNQAGYEDISARLDKEFNALNADTYKIAVVGEFKAGKSTLINMVFLKDNALFTDIMEATAVPTEIHYSNKKLLKIIPYITTTYKEINPFNENLSTELEISEKEGKPVEIANPTREDIKTQTSADTPEKRAALARKTARVKLYWTANNLAGLTVFDTPGINTINEAVIATTYRIIPETDLVLFVTNAKQLSSIEMEFLSSRVFSEGITRAIIVVTYDPNAGILSETQRENLLNIIQSQLANIGRGDVPVEMVNIRDTTAHDKLGMSFKDKVNAENDRQRIKENARKVINDVIGNLLGESSGSEESSEHRILHSQLSHAAASDTDIRVAALEEKLIQFIRENVRPGRIEKAVQVLKIQIQLALVRCSAELSAMNKSESERQQLLNSVKARETEIRKKYEQLSTEFREEFGGIQIQFITEAEQGLTRIANAYIAGFDACRGLGELQNRLNNAEVILKRDIEEMFLTCSQRIRKKMKAIIEKYGIRSQVLLNPWQADISRELSIDGGILSKIPSFAVFTIDVLLFVHLGPFGPLADILIRLLANYIPYINKVMPAAIAGHVLKNNIRKSVTDQFERIKTELPVRIEETFRQTGDKLLNEWKASADEQLETVRKSLEKAVEHSTDHQRQVLLTEIQTKLEFLFEKC